jgi:hypothetical protein
MRVQLNEFRTTVEYQPPEGEGWIYDGPGSSLVLNVSHMWKRKTDQWKEFKYTSSPHPPGEGWILEYSTWYGLSSRPLKTKRYVWSRYAYVWRRTSTRQRTCRHPYSM